MLWTIPTGKRECQSQNHALTSILTVVSGVQTAAADTDLTSAKQLKVSFSSRYVFVIIPTVTYTDKFMFFSVITPTEKPPSVGKLFKL